MKGYILFVVCCCFVYRSHGIKIKHSKNIPKKDAPSHPIQELQTELQNQAQIIKHMMETQAALLARLDHLEDKVIEQADELEEKTIELEATDELLKDILATMDKAGDAEEVEQDIILRNRRLVTLRPDDAIAFQAHLSGTKHTNLGLHENIKCDTVLFNDGGGYNNHTGVFTAPRSGVYMFSAAVLTGTDDHSILYADLAKNDEAIARLHAVHNNDYATQTGITVVTRLAKDDKVWVRISGSENVSIWGEKYTFFSGAFIHKVDN